MPKFRPLPLPISSAFVGANCLARILFKECTYTSVYFICGQSVFLHVMGVYGCMWVVVESSRRGCFQNPLFLGFSFCVFMIEYPYHLQVKIMSRSKGHNALKAASYRSGQRLRQEPPLSDVFNAPEPVTAPRAVFDYSRRKGVMSSFIAAPKDVPAWVTSVCKKFFKIVATPVITS